MNLIQISHAGGVVQYPDDQALFSKTRHVPALAIVVADYSGALTLTPYTGPWPIGSNVGDPVVFPGVATALLGSTPDSGKAGYRTIYKEAYPHGSSPNSDDIALLFFELLNRPTAADGKVDLMGAEIDAALDHFVTQGWITAADKVYVQAGVVST